MSGQVLVAHACNPIYSGDRDQEDHSLEDLISKKKKKTQQQQPNYKKVLEV
jgi:hypothetical protein